MANNRLSARSVVSTTGHGVLIVRDAERIRLAHQVLPYCELSKLRLRSCISESTEDVNALTPPFSMEISDSTAHSLGIREDHLVAEVSVTAESFDSSAEKKIVFRFGCIFHVYYYLQKGFTPTNEQANAFAEDYGVFNSWPFIRELFQTMMHRMDLSPPALPFLRQRRPPALPLVKVAAKKRKTDKSQT